MSTSGRDAAVARAAFFRGFLHGVRVVWPVLSGLLVAIAGLGLTVAVLEDWSLGDGMYFGAITAMTIGYGDLTPTRTLTRAIAAAIGFLGIVTTALIAGVAVTAVQGSLGSRGVAGQMRMADAGRDEVQRRDSAE